jgi:O-antigen/teichoic acid export membrane protein
MANKGFAGSYFLLLINEGVYSLSVVIVSIVLGRFLGANALGLFAMITAYMVLYLEVCSLGVDITLIREYSKKAISTKTLLKTIYLMRLPLTVISILLFALTLYFLKIDARLILICAAVLLLRSSKLLINALFFSKKCIGEIVAGDIIFSVCYLGFFLVAVFTLEKGVTGVFVSQLLALGVSLAFSVWLLKKSEILKNHPASEDGTLIKVFHQAKWFSINPILGTIQGKISFYLLSVVSMPVNIGLLSVGEVFKSILFRVFNSIFSKLLLPSFGEIHKSEKQIKSLFFKTNTFFAIASLIMVILALPLVQPVILLTYGREYLNSVLLAQLFILEGMLFTLSLSETTIIKLYREDLSARISMLGFVLTLPMTLIFYYYFDLKGLVFASFIITLIRLLYGTFLCSNILGIRIFDTYVPQISSIYFLIAFYLFCEFKLVPLVIIDMAIIVSFSLMFVKRPLIFNLWMGVRAREITR